MRRYMRGSRRANQISRAAAQAAAQATARQRRFRQLLAKSRNVYRKFIIERRRLRLLNYRQRRLGNVSLPFFTRMRWQLSARVAYWFNRWQAIRRVLTSMGARQR